MSLRRVERPEARASSSSAERMSSASISRRSVIPSSVSARVSASRSGISAKKAIAKLAVTKTAQFMKRKFEMVFTTHHQASIRQHDNLDLLVQL